MAKNEQIRVDITATDDASAVLGDVADAAEKVEDLSPEIEVGADVSAAESDLQDVEGTADDLGRLSPEIEVTADTSTASSDIADVDAEAKAAADADREIVLKAKISDATRALKSLRGDLEQTEDKAEDAEAAVRDVGSKGGELPAGNAIADLAGPLGDAEGAASTAAGAFEGFGDIAGGIAGKLGASESAVAGLTGVIGGLGFAIAAGAAAYTYFSGKAEAAKQKQEELTAATRDFNDALAEGDTEAAAEQLVGMFEDAFAAADDFNVPLSETVDYITGLTGDLPTLEQAISDNADAMADAQKKSDDYYKSTGFLDQGQLDLIATLGATGDELKATKGEVDKARGAYDKTNGILAKQDETTRGVSKALQKHADDTEKSARKQERLKRETEKLDEALDDLKGALNFERTLIKFEQDFAEAYRKVKNGKKLTGEEILDLKDDILDVAEFAKLTPAEVRTLLRRVDRGDIQGVRDAVQTYMDAHTVNTPAGIKLKPEATKEVNEDAQQELNAYGIRYGPVEIPTKYQVPALPPGLPGSPGAPGPRSVPPTEVVNVTMHLPRGYRELDVVAAGRRAARRSGGLYRRTRR